MDEIESWDEFLEVLEQFEWTPSHQVEGGTIYSPSTQLEQQLAESEWYHSDGYSEDDPPEGVGSYSLLAMNWISHGAPISFDGFLEYVQVGDEAAYLFYYLEGAHDTPELLAKIVWPHFFAIQLLLVVMIFAYCVLRELIRVIGRRKTLEMFFGTPVMKS